MDKVICEFAGCDRDSVAKGLCRAHYQQQWKGAQMVPLEERKTRSNFPKAKSREEFFWLRVEKSEGCWNWIGSQNGVGYGALQFQGSTTGAHRYSYELNVGPIRPGGVIDHLCHTPLCVNPAHLRVATHSQNMQNLDGLQSNNKSGVRGVYWSDSKNRWRATIGAGGKKHHAGYFHKIEDAALAADELRRLLHS